MIFSAMSDDNITIKAIVSVFECSGSEGPGRYFQDAGWINCYIRAFKPISSQVYRRTATTTAFKSAS
jgi:hypothetical protein